MKEGKFVSWLRNSRPSAYREFSRVATSSWQQNESRIREEIACRYAANNAVEKAQNGGETQIRNTLRRISSSQMLTRNTRRVTARTTLR